MSQGLTDCTPCIQKVKRMQNVRDLGVLPRNSIRAGSEERMDAVEREVLSTKQPQVFREVFQDEPVMRSVQPILSG